MSTAAIPALVQHCNVQEMHGGEGEVQRERELPDIKNCWHFTIANAETGYIFHVGGLGNFHQIAGLFGDQAEIQLQ